MYAKAITKIPEVWQATATISLFLGSIIYAKVASPLVNHISTTPTRTRFSVTSWLYLKCKKTENNLSNAMAAVVKNDAATRKYKAYIFAVKR